MAIPLVPLGIQALIRAIGPRVGQAAARVARSRFGQGTGGALRASETPTGILTAMEGVEEDSGLQTGLGAGLALSGLTQLVPGARNVSRLFRRRKAKTIPGKMAESGKFSRQDAMLRNTQKQLEDAPGIGGLFRAERKRPFTTQATLIGGGTAAGAGVDQFNDRVLGRPIDYEELDKLYSVPEDSVNKKEAKDINLQIIEQKRQEAIEQADTRGASKEEINQLNTNFDNQKKNAEILYQNALQGDFGDFSQGGPPIKDAFNTPGDVVDGIVTQEVEKNSDIPITKNNPTDVMGAANDATATTMTTFDDYMKFVDVPSLSPQENLDIMKNVGQAYARSSELIQEAREELNSTEKQSFDDFFAEFKKMTGENEDKGHYHALLKMGTSLMKSRSYDGGLSGFLTNLGEAGGEAADMLYQQYQQDKNLRRSLASNYIEHNRALERDALNYGRQLSAAEMGLAKEMATTTLNMGENERARQIGFREKYLDYQNKLQVANINAGAGGLKIASQMTATIADKNYPGEVRTVILATTENGNVLEAIQPGGTGAQQFIQPTFNISEAEPTKATENDRADYIQQMDVSYDTAQTVKGLKQIKKDGSFTGATGSAGAIVAFKGKVDATVKGIAQSFGLKLYNDGNDAQQLFDTTEDIRIKDRLLQGAGPKTTAEDIADINKMFDKEMAERANSKYQRNYAEKLIAAGGKQFTIQDFDNNQDVRRLVAKITVFEQRLKYLIADSLKGKDRLTVADINEAAKYTKLTGFFVNPQAVISGLEDVILPVAQSNFEKAVRSYKRSGGGDGLLYESYPESAYLQSFKKKGQQKSVTDEQTQGAINNIIGKNI
ncbi:MAG: hypothetical protein CMC70_04570 [Flavobacteriaceae bacterium]|nr:hypothetical protein [Flavobacteriaceae bacterium]